MLRSAKSVRNESRLPGSSMAALRCVLWLVAALLLAANVREYHHLIPRRFPTVTARSEPVDDGVIRCSAGGVQIVDLVTVRGRRWSLYVNWDPSTPR
jgi:hypothetical protein